LLDKKTSVPKTLVFLLWYNHSMKQKKILIVDDEVDLREALSGALTAAGFATITATDGEEGIKLALEHKPDLILLDIVMPNMNGHKALSQIRKDAWGKTVPVLFLTNSDDPANMIQGFGLKGSDYLIKSNTSLDEITKRVRLSLAGY